MDNKKIPTFTGTAILVIIAITVGAFIWVYEGSVMDVVVPDYSYQQLNNNQQKQLLEWKIFENKDYDFEVQYPSDYLFDENFMDGVEYSVNFGPSYEKTFGKKHPYRKTADSFEISIAKSKDGLGDFLERQVASEAAIEHDLKVVGIEKISDISAKVAQECDMGGNCSKIVYFEREGYIYTISMKNYFTEKRVGVRERFDHTLDSFKLK